MFVVAFVFLYANSALVLGGAREDPRTDGIENKLKLKLENLKILPAREVKVVKVPIEKVRPPDLKYSREDFVELSPYQRYVTPEAPAIQALATITPDAGDAYQKAVNWTWVSDQVLHGTQEKWLYPQEFLTETPTKATNPVRPKPASDCESQAYTLVSLLRSMGAPPEDVRVAIGKVRFGDQEGGHAWVEVYVDNRWMALEATSGPYWDEGTGQLVQREGFPYDYFGSHSYPSTEVWAYFNDAYFYNASTGEGNAPPHWITGLELDWISIIIFLTLLGASTALAVGVVLAGRRGHAR